MSTETIAFFSFVCLLWPVFCWVRRVRFPAIPLPPGPKGYPVVGNAFDIPAYAPWLTFQNWAKTYGDIMYVGVPMQDFVVLGTAEAAFDLLEKRSEIYSDRPAFVMHEMLLLDKIFALMSYSPDWRYQRREFHQYFHTHELSKFRPIQRYQCRLFLRSVLANPSDLAQHLRFLNTAINLKIVYDMDIVDIQDEYVQVAFDTVSAIALSSLPGNFWVEFFPIFRYLPHWVPGTSFKNFIEKYRPAISKMLNDPFDRMKEEMASGHSGTSLVATLLQKLDSSTEEGPERRKKEELMRNIAVTAYLGAADTSTDMVQVFLVAMSLYPDVQRKAQAELDHYVGPDRLPDFGDFDNLIYLQAIILETIRWIPITPLAFPHLVAAEDDYKGFRIPKGATVLANVWAMLHNPEEYPDPKTFNPDRFIKDGRLNPDVRDPFTLAFGFGRRSCPGRWFLQASSFLTIANILQVFDTHLIPQPDGKTYDPFKEAFQGLKTHFETLPCTMTPRSPAAKQLILECALSHE